MSKVIRFPKANPEDEVAHWVIIDKTKEEEVAVTVHERSSLTEQIEALVIKSTDFVLQLRNGS